MVCRKNQDVQRRGAKGDSCQCLRLCRTQFDSSTLNHSPAKRDVQPARAQVLRLLRFL